MEQRLFVKISRRDGLQCRQLHLKLPELYGDDALFNSEVCDGSQQFVMGREYVEDGRRTGRLPDFRVHIRIQSAIEVMPLVSV
jgi:hypothetical protein